MSHKRRISADPAPYTSKIFKITITLNYTQPGDRNIILHLMGKDHDYKRGFTVDCLGHLLEFTNINIPMIRDNKQILFETGLGGNTYSFADEAEKEAVKTELDKFVKSKVTGPYTWNVEIEEVVRMYIRPYEHHALTVHQINE